MENLNIIANALGWEVVKTTDNDHLNGYWVLEIGCGECECIKGFETLKEVANFLSNEISLRLLNSKAAA